MIVVNKYTTTESEVLEAGARLFDPRPEGCGLKHQFAVEASGGETAGSALEAYGPIHP